MLSFLSAHSKPQDFPSQFSDEIYYSDVYAFESFSYESVYSLKYLSEGEERYLIDGREKVLRSGEYLIVNNKSPVDLMPAAQGKAISIFIDPETMAEAVYSLKNSDGELLDDPGLLKMHERPLFYEGVYPAKDHELGETLSQTLQDTLALLKKGYPRVEKSFFYSIAQDLIKNQSKSIEHLQLIDSAKNSTRQELLFRLKKAQEFLHADPFGNYYLEDLAQIATLSPFHFHRSFVKVFGISPLKYHQTIKMEIAQQELLQSNQSISELALQLGFADSSSFGKVFKRETGLSPMKWKKSNLRRLHPLGPD